MTIAGTASGTDMVKLGSGFESVESTGIVAVFPGSMEHSEAHNDAERQTL